MAIRLGLEKNLEEEFRKKAMKQFGYSKGALKKASTEAIKSWPNIKTGNYKKVDNPVSLIEGIFRGLKGKISSVELQHKGLKLWVK